MDISDVRKNIAIVNGGSGCIFQPMDMMYSYILTAKHNIEDNKNLISDLIRFELIDGAWQQRNIGFGNLTIGENYFPHPVKDIAILKTSKIEGINNVVRVDNLDADSTGFYLTGYPGVRRNGKDYTNSYRIDINVSILDIKGAVREAQVDLNPTIDEIKGQSGGAILKFTGNYLFLAGIQNKMEHADNEQLGRIHFTPISNFDEIINEYKLYLSPILPPHLTCFSFLKNEAFNLNGGWYPDDVEFTKNYLKNRTELIVASGTTPIAIKRFFENRLLVNKQKEEVLQTRNIWLMWLEFLTILNIVKYSVFDENELYEIFNSYRLLYTDTVKDWSSEVTNMVYSDYKGLKNNGIVIIGISTPAYNNMHILDNKIPLITQAKRSKDSSKLLIDDGISFPFDKFKFVHIDYFKDGTIVKKHEEYKDILDEGILLEKLKTEYGKLFNA